MLMVQCCRVHIVAYAPDAIWVNCEPVQRLYVSHYDSLSSTFALTDLLVSCTSCYAAVLSIFRVERRKSATV